MKHLKYDLIVVSCFIVIGFFMDFLWVGLAMSIVYILVLLAYERHYTKWVEEEMKKYQGKEQKEQRHL